MAVATRHRSDTRKALNQHPPRSSPRRPARPDLYTERVAAFRRGVVVGISAGLSLALVIIALAFLTGVGTGIGGALHGAAGAAAAQAAGPPPKPAGASVEVHARHVGALKVQIQAEVGAAQHQSRSALQQAEVVAYADMVQMPGSHRVGPITMRDVPGRPGLYQGEATVPMLGQYEVSVEVERPLTGSGRQTVEVTTIPTPEQ